jgi:hypothetical protein
VAADAAVVVVDFAEVVVVEVFRAAAGVSLAGVMAAVAALAVVVAIFREVVTGEEVTRAAG